jgi:hypothetical protein
MGFAFEFLSWLDVCVLRSGVQSGGAATLSPEIKRRSLKMELLPPNSGSELATTFIRGK